MDKIEKAIEELQAATEEMKEEVRLFKERSAAIFAKTRKLHV